jgi:hypothetical protein
MKKFLTKILVFSTPILILFLIPAFFLRMSSENYRTIDDVVKNEKHYLIGYAYNEENYGYLKHKELENRDSLSVVALGSSRILQFRDKMFTKPFYNAGYTVSGMAAFLPFIKANLENNKPKVLLINLDQWMFNENWDDLADYGKIHETWEPNFRKNASFSTLSSVWSDLLKGKYGFEMLNQNKKSDEMKIGLNAMVNNKGFRKDGSMDYGNQIVQLLQKDSTVNDFNHLGTFSRIATGTNRFQFGKQINEKALKALDDLLQYCKNNSIYIVAIIPPFADDVNLRLEKQAEKYAYMKDIYPRSKTLFEKQGFELWDMTYLNKYGSNDSETLDGFHGGEVAYLKMLMYMVEHGSMLKNYTNAAILKQALIKRKNNYEVYE